MWPLRCGFAPWTSPSTTDDPTCRMARSIAEAYSVTVCAAVAVCLMSGESKLDPRPDRCAVKHKASRRGPRSLRGKFLRGAPRPTTSRVGELRKSLLIAHRSDTLRCSHGPRGGHLRPRRHAGRYEHAPRPARFARLG